MPRDKSTRARGRPSFSFRDHGAPRRAPGSRGHPACDLHAAGLTTGLGRHAGRRAWLSPQPSQSQAALELRLRRGGSGVSSPSSACGFSSRGLGGVPSGSLLHVPTFQVCGVHPTAHTTSFTCLIVSGDPHTEHAGQVPQTASPPPDRRRNDISTSSLVSVTGIDAERQHWGSGETSRCGITWSPHEVTTSSPRSGWTSHAQQEQRT